MGLLGLILLLSGCSSYYYAKLDSEDRINVRNSTRDFVIENDTVGVIYCFYGENAPVQITVHNKLDKPLYVDWTRSGVIMDDVASGFDSNTLSIRGNISMDGSVSSVQWGEGYSSSSISAYERFMGEATLPRGVSFIPPRSRVEHTPVSLAHFSFDKIPDKEFTEVVYMDTRSNERKVKSITFTEQDSPLHFRSYLTLYTDAQDVANRKVLYLERSFYLSRLLKTGNIPPANFEEGAREDGDFFYVHKVKGADTGLILGTIAVGVVGIAVQAAVGPVTY